MIDAYLLISQVYQRGDKIWLFGFSRGAWAARSLGAFIARSGLIPAADADDDSAADQAEKIWLNYKEDRGKKRGGRFWKHHDETPIRMIGVWDTVGELGVPVFNGLRLVDRDELRFLKFNDRELSPRVEHGRQALAIDEERADFVRRRCGRSARGSNRSGSRARMPMSGAATKTTVSRTLRSNG
jgi:uncharacterized protein (DUF2235 family)